MKKYTLKNYDSRKVALCLILSGALSTSACTSHNSGRISISADEAGMRAFGDMITGSITTGKASPDQNTAHHIMRETQERTQALRYTSKTFNKGGK